MRVGDFDLTNIGNATDLILGRMATEVRINGESRVRAVSLESSDSFGYGCGDIPDKRMEARTCSYVGVKLRWFSDC